MEAPRRQFFVKTGAVRGVNSGRTGQLFLFDAALRDFEAAVLCGESLRGLASGPHLANGPIFEREKDLAEALVTDLRGYRRQPGTSAAIPAAATIEFGLGFGLVFYYNTCACPAIVFIKC